MVALIQDPVGYHIASAVCICGLWVLIGFIAFLFYKDAGN